MGAGAEIPNRSPVSRGVSPNRKGIVLRPDDASAVAVDLPREVRPSDQRALEIAAEEWPGRGGCVRSKFKTVVAGPDGNPLVTLGECRVGFWNQFGDFVVMGHGDTWGAAFKSAGIEHAKERGA